MNRNKQRILVLSDLKDNSFDTLKYAINISKEINGALELFCVKKPCEIVTTENPLCAMRVVNSEFVKTEQKARNLVKSITKDNFFPLKTTIKFGNIKSEIDTYIKDANPDFIILGKKQKKLLNLYGDNVTNFVLKEYKDKTFVTNKTTISEVFDSLNNKNKSSHTA